MSHLDILLPFGYPPQEIAGDLLRELQLPAFATLLARARPEPGSEDRQETDAFARALPHEAWLARRFGLEPGMRQGGSPPIASAAMHEFGLHGEPGVWFILNPVHIHIARDHLVLTDPRQLDLPERESRALFAIAQPLFEEAGKTLLHGNAKTWFARADDWAHLQTSTPDAASGHNIDIWMPKGDGERNWRKLQNEVQMHWFSDPVNTERESRGAKPVNSIWLWGGSAGSTAGGARPYTDLFNLHGWPRALSRVAGLQVLDCAAADIIGKKPERGLVVLEHLIEPALSNDWSRWLEEFRAFETNWFAPLHDALKSGRIDRISFILTHQTRLTTYTASRNSLRKFWIKPSIATLLS